MSIDSDFWAGRRVLVTGHTGFKGAWLALWLSSLGSEVSGLSAGVPSRPSFYERSGGGACAQERTADIRDAPAVLGAVRELAPEVVFHLAAQPLVRRSLREPAATYEANVLGTANVLDAVREAGVPVRAVVVVTSDKCYANPPGTRRRFVESDPLGGEDPYSSSKACAELVCAAYRSSFFGSVDAPRLATARAGNVIGGGDWGEDRLLADVLRAIGERRPLLVRNPGAVRPWQHVLSPLSGYLRLAEELWRGPEAARAWNFGPREHDERTVGAIADSLVELWDGELSWRSDADEHPREAGHLALDSSAAEAQLGWRPACDLDAALRLVVDWHRAERRGEDMRAVSLAQIGALST
ncbi:MAG TPA: CDP-glucose 4,6-dehydratase [Solirubrobacteraceae bacterium]|nr:CDP-glucose 4,6-dehydratase [Solirubrobacteraceae bacterium]